METYYQLEVFGWTWGGFKSVYSYRLDQPLTDEKRALARAGDFSRLLDWRLVKVTHDYELAGCLYRRSDTYKTLRGFRSGMTPRRFYRLANA